MAPGAKDEFPENKQLLESLVAFPDHYISSQSQMNNDYRLI
jgi:hypothetical protein